MLDLSTWCDISHFQNFRPGSDVWSPIDFQRMADQGVEGVAVRKTIGRFHDPSFEANWRGAGDVPGFKRTVYCVPYVAYDMAKQQEVMATWPSGGVFDDEVDTPAWADVERKHSLTRQQAINRLMPYLGAMMDTFGEAEVYTAKYVWQDFYSIKYGWHKDWGLVVAYYRPDLYDLSVWEIKDMVANLEIQPLVPLGWERDVMGDLIPRHLAWEQWQIMADGNGLGAQYGVNSRDIDISFRQGELPGEQPVVDLEALREAFGRLRLAYVEEGAIMEEIEGILNG